MGNRWTVEDNAPPKGEKYDWRSPGNEEQHQSHTVIPGDLRIKPKDVSLKPTLAPKQSGLQWGWNAWETQVEPSSGGWYVEGVITQDED